MQKNSDY